MVKKEYSACCMVAFSQVTQCWFSSRSVKRVYTVPPQYILCACQKQAVRMLERDSVCMSEIDCVVNVRNSMHVRKTHSDMRARAHTHTHTQTHTRTHARTHARTHTHTHAHTDTHTRTHARTHSRTHTHTHGINQV